MRILISNDDGVYAEGISVLADSLKDMAEIIVIAPDRNRSGASNSLTLDLPVTVKELPNGYFSVEGTPTDCVHLGVTGFFDEMPDMVISGINHGANLGDDTIYSGTVAAATEGRFLGLPAIAMSLVGETHFETAGKVARQIVERVLAKPLPPATILNVNVPDVPFDQIKGMEVTRLGKRHIAEKVIKDTSPRGKRIYWIGEAGLEQDGGEGTDFFAIKRNVVAITPLQVDLTNYAGFEQMSQWLEG